MKLGKDRQGILILAALIGLGLLVSDKLIFSPLIRLWKERNARIESLRKSVNTGALLLERASGIEQRWASMKKTALPSDTSEAENQILKSVERWAQESRISFTSIKPQWKRSADDYTTLECRADAFGDLQSVSRFIYALERDPLALRIEDLQVTARDNLGQQLSLGVRFSGLLLEEDNQ